MNAIIGLRPNLNRTKVGSQNRAKINPQSRHRIREVAPHRPLVWVAWAEGDQENTGNTTEGLQNGV